MSTVVAVNAGLLITCSVLGMHHTFFVFSASIFMQHNCNWQISNTKKWLYEVPKQV